MDNLVIRSDQLLESEAAPLRVTLNGQQYSAATAFGYNGALNVSRVAPAPGPAAGGTQLRVHGYSFEGGVASEYACRFGSAELGWQQVPATLHAGYDELGRKNEPLLRCVSPAPPSGAAAARHARLQVSSNGQQFTSASLPYFYHPHPVVEAVAPAAGPTEGGTPAGSNPDPRPDPNPNLNPDPNLNPSPNPNPHPHPHPNPDQ